MSARGGALAKATHGVLGAGGSGDEGVDLAGDEGEGGAEEGGRGGGRWAAAGPWGRNKRRVTRHILNTVTPGGPQVLGVVCALLSFC